MPDLPESLTFPIGPGVAVRMEGLVHTAAPLHRWLARAVGSLASEPDPGSRTVVIRFGPEVDVAWRRLAEQPLGLADGGFVVADHLGRVALLPYPAFRTSPVVVDGRMHYYAFEQWVLLPAIAGALHEQGGGLLRVAAVRLGDRVVGIAGLMMGGKTTTVLELLDRGAGLLGDDVVAIGADGAAFPLSQHLFLRQGHRDQLGTNWPGGRRWVPRAGEWIAHRVARISEPWPLLSVGAGRVARALQKFDTAVVGVHELHPGAEAPAPGRLDALVVLTHEPLSSSARLLAERLAGQLRLEYPQLGLIEAALATVAPGQPRAFPTLGEHAERIDSILSGVPVHQVVVEPGTAPAAVASRVLEAAVGPGVSAASAGP